MLTCYYTCSLLYLELSFCFTYETYLDPQHGGVYVVIIDREFSDVTAPYLYHCIVSHRISYRGVLVCICQSVIQSVCVCPSVLFCPVRAQTFEILDIETSLLVCKHVFRTSRSFSYIKVTESRSRSQEQKRVSVDLVEYK